MMFDMWNVIVCWAFVRELSCANWRMDVMLIKYTYQTKARHTHTQRNDNAQKHAKYSTATYISITCAYLLIKYCTPNDKMLFKVATVVHIDGSKKSFTPSHTHTHISLRHFQRYLFTFLVRWCVRCSDTKCRHTFRLVVTTPSIWFRAFCTSLICSVEVWMKMFVYSLCIWKGIC